jgi:hypothetical protein
VARAQHDMSEFNVPIYLIVLCDVTVSYKEYDPGFLQYREHHVATNIKQPLPVTHWFRLTCAILNARVHRSLLSYLTSLSRTACWVASLCFLSDIVDD